MRFVRLSLIITALYLWAPVSTSQAQLKNQKFAVLIEPVRVGDRFIYTISETRQGRKRPIARRSTLVERVVSTNATYENRSGARKLLRDTVTGESVYYAETPGVSFFMNEPSALTSLRSAGQWKSYPLSIAKGKSIKLPESEQVIDLGSSKSSTKTSTSLSILGKEKLKVGKKTYSCVKIRETITTVSKTVPQTDAKATKAVAPKTSRETRVSTLWYSPELQTLVKYTTSRGKLTFTQTLTKLVKAPQQTALLLKK
jgi:hypothetical protein